MSCTEREREREHLKFPEHILIGRDNVVGVMIQLWARWSGV
jgi:hypothetical protein